MASTLVNLIPEFQIEYISTSDDFKTSSNEFRVNLHSVADVDKFLKFYQERTKTQWIVNCRHSGKASKTNPTRFVVNKDYLCHHTNLRKGLVSVKQAVLTEPEFYWESTKVKPVKLEVDIRHTHVPSGQSASGKPLGTIPALEGYSRVVDLQKSWVNDALMVWQKRGVRDTGLYYATMGGCVIGAGYCFYLIYKMSFPKKVE